MREHLIAAGVFLLVGSASHAAGRSIVGTWAPDPKECTPIGGMIEIGPRSLTGDEMACEFRDVARSGDVVTWHGRCSESGVSRQATVVADLVPIGVRIIINGKDSGTYRRCTAGSAPASMPESVEPWPGDRWRADVDEHRHGHVLHVTMLGSTTTTGRGDSLDVACADRDVGTGKTTLVHHHAWALSRQDDYEGDAGPLGIFGMGLGRTLRWFGATPCAAGPITWHRL